MCINCNTKSNSRILLSVCFPEIHPNTHVPLHRFATDCVPFVPELTEHVVQFLVVILQGGLVLQSSARATGGVIHRMLAAQSFLELLRSPTQDKQRQRVIRTELKGTGPASHPVRPYGKPDVIKSCQLYLWLTHQNIWSTAELLITHHHEALGSESHNPLLWVPPTRIRL